MAKSFKLTTENQVNANLALKHRLYVSKRDFCLSETLQDIRSGYDVDSRVVIHSENGIPVGVAVYNPLDSVNLQIFVKKSMRRKGVGSKLMSALKAPNGSTCGYGAPASSKFWKNRDDVFMV
jgi:hypothetical protein